MNGRSGKGVDDLYTPEITNVGGYDNTLSVVCTAQNDALKVKAVVNEIKGWNHDGTKHVGVPTVFGMNFQAVSVGQKLLKDNSDGGCPADTDPTINGQQGGYVDGLGTPSAVLGYGLKKTTSDALLADHRRVEGSQDLRFDAHYRYLEARSVAHQFSEAREAGPFRGPRLQGVRLQHQRGGQDHHRRGKQLSGGTLRLGAG